MFQLKIPLTNQYNASMSNILVADDHSIVRLGIKSLIRDSIGINNIDEAENEQGIVNAVKDSNYDIIILDINMGDSDFVKLMDWLSFTCPDTCILIFTMYHESIYGLRCIQLGARGYLNKTAPDEEIILAIKTVLNGKKYINAALSEILSQNAENKQTNPFLSLSSREIEIALLLYKGKRLPEICTILNIQYSTANTYKRRIFEKLNVNDILSLSRLMQSFNIQE